LIAEEKILSSTTNLEFVYFYMGAEVLFVYLAYIVITFPESVRMLVTEKFALTDDAIYTMNKRGDITRIEKKDIVSVYPAYGGERDIFRILHIYATEKSRDLWTDGLSISRTYFHRVEILLERRGKELFIIL
jgi:hypothetical protein